VRMNRSFGTGSGANTPHQRPANAHVRRWSPAVGSPAADGGAAAGKRSAGSANGLRRVGKSNLGRHGPTSNPFGADEPTSELVGSPALSVADLALFSPARLDASGRHSIESGTARSAELAGSPQNRWQEQRTHRVPTFSLARGPSPVDTDVDRMLQLTHKLGLRGPSPVDTDVDRMLHLTHKLGLRGPSPIDTDVDRMLHLTGDHLEDGSQTTAVDLDVDEGTNDDTEDEFVGQCSRCCAPCTARFCLIACGCGGVRKGGVRGKGARGLLRKET
jgi:hypothetical protein